jgi:hypothetical protein
MELMLWLKANAGWIVTAVAFCLFMHFAHRRSKAYETYRLRERNQYLRQTLTHHGVGEVQILKDNTIKGGPSGDGGHTPYQVHLILHSPPDRWFLYLHVEGSAPVLSPLSEQRALLAVNA